ncbi:penicillin-binding protein activator [Methylocaldum sp.]|uniref:penicillin-binding protein activator n=1 Tax=Methylocaldum sp. TaxID=1969727 RepID=UPI002D6FD457|nr:penicillin-binding protein activator [Methylocaldum sp.]HYE36030.1 penicillin-binding protein activator [Methylocaldum sp.]
MPLFIRLCIALLMLTVAACARDFAKRDGTAARASQAESLLQTGDYSGAIRLFQQLAETSGDPDYYRLRAADSALRAGDGRMAKRLADAIDPDELETADRHDYTLLQSRLDLNVGRAREALAKLDSLSTSRLESPQKAHYHTLRASAYNQLGNMLESARERVKLGQMLTHPDAVQKNNEAIYDALARVPEKVLAGMQPPPPDVLGGWMNLTQIIKTTPPAGLNSELTKWHARFPGHPADGEFLQGLLQQPDKATQSIPPGQPQPGAPTSSAATSSASFIGVMLPLSGSYAPAAQALRTGMIAAYYADANAAKPPLRFIDTQSGDIHQLYRKLADDGAKIIVGPLIKENVTTLAKTGDLPVPVLGLNQIPETSNDRVYQFGLTPEHEVEQAAGSAWFDGRQNALVLAPANQFGQRMIKHFVAYWNQLGGKIRAIKTYPHHGEDFTASVKELVAAAPTTTHAELSTSPIPSAPATKQGADFIFLVSDVRDAHLILPQLAFHQGDHIPVYATSHVYGGRADSQADQDLNGLIFCDIPWLLDPSESGPLSAQALKSQIQQTPPDYLRLIALGIDAYRLLPELERLKTDPQYRYMGTTGTLSLEPGNRIQRQLHCSQFEGGVPQPRGIAPLLRPSAGPPGFR